MTAGVRALNVGLVKHYILFIGLGHVDSLEQRSQYIEMLERRMLEKFGGFSHSVVSGGWRSPSGEICREYSLRVEIVTDSSYFKDWVDSYVKTLFKQESVLVLDSNSTVQFV